MKKETKNNKSGSWPLFFAFLVAGIFLIYISPDNSIPMWRKILGIIFLDIAILGAGQGVDETAKTNAYFEIALGLVFMLLALQFVFIFPTNYPTFNLIIELIFILLGVFGFTKGVQNAYKENAGVSQTKTEDIAVQEKVINKYSFDSKVNFVSMVIATLSLILQFFQG